MAFAATSRETRSRDRPKTVSEAGLPKTDGNISSRRWLANQVIDKIDRKSERSLRVPQSRHDSVFCRLVIGFKTTLDVAIRLSCVSLMTPALRLSF